MAGQAWVRSPPGQISAVTYVKHQGGGGSQAELITGSDGKNHVVKFRGNPQGTRILANEYVSSQLGAILEAPIPTGRVMAADAAFIGRVPIKYGNVLAKEGSQFASEFQCDDNGATFQAPVPSILKQLTNRDQVATMLVFDNLVANEDSKLEHIIHHPVKGGQRFWEVDFGHSLGITRGGRGLAPTPPTAPLRVPCLAACVESMEEFEPALRRVDERLTPEVIDGILSEVPLADWEVAQDDPGYLKAFLLGQKAHIRSRVATSRGLLPNCKGGG